MFFHNLYLTSIYCILYQKRLIVKYFQSASCLTVKSRKRERLHKEVASPLGFVAGQIDRIVGKINHTGGLQNETALHR